MSNNFNLNYYNLNLVSRNYMSTSIMSHVSHFGHFNIHCYYNTFSVWHWRHSLYEQYYTVITAFSDNFNQLEILTMPERNSINQIINHFAWNDIMMIDQWKPHLNCVISGVCSKIKLISIILIESGLRTVVYASRQPNNVSSVIAFVAVFFFFFCFCSKCDWRW